jgi:hypothetical protein
MTGIFIASWQLEITARVARSVRSGKSSHPTPTNECRRREAGSRVKFGSFASNLTLMSRRGDSYEVTDRAFAVFKNGLDLENIQPHLPKADILVHELPASAVRGSVLQINDLWSGDKAKITLGI